MLLTDRLMPIESAPVADRLKASAEAAGCRLPLENPVATVRLPPVVGEAQKVERIGTLGSEFR